jgi:hypothetical protein
MSGLSRRAREALCDEVVERFALPPSATHQEACRRTGEVMSELLGAQVEVRFASLRNVPFSGATVRHADGSYVVYCAKSRSWYHRLGILLHELAHVLLDHPPVASADSSAVRLFAPHLPGKMARIIAGRTVPAEAEEREAEELADRLLERLTERPPKREDAALLAATPRVLRIAQGLARYRGDEDQPRR